MSHYSIMIRPVGGGRGQYLLVYERPLFIGQYVDAPPSLGHTIDGSIDDPLFIGVAELVEALQNNRKVSPPLVGRGNQQPVNVFQDLYGTHFCVIFSKFSAKVKHFYS